MDGVAADTFSVRRENSSLVRPIWKSTTSNAPPRAITTSKIVVRMFESIRWPCAPTTAVCGDESGMCGRVSRRKLPREQITGQIFQAGVDGDGRDDLARRRAHARSRPPPRYSARWTCRRAGLPHAPAAPPSPARPLRRSRGPRRTACRSCAVESGRSRCPRRGAGRRALAVIAGELAGSSATMRVSAPPSRSARATPLSMPPVPTAPQNTSIDPPACSSSSRPMPAYPSSGIHVVKLIGPEGVRLGREDGDLASGIARRARASPCRPRSARFSTPRRTRASSAASPRRTHQTTAGARDSL